MCEASVYMIRDGKEELVLESVDLLENENGEINMVNMFGDQKSIRAKIKKLSLVNHKIILEDMS